MVFKKSVFSIWLVILFSFCWLPFESNAALVAHWTFDEAGGSTQVVDTVGGLVGNLSATGATLASGGKAGGALSLDKGTGGYVTMGDVLRLGTGPYSFVVWIKTSSPEATTVVIAKQQDGIHAGYHISINENGPYGLPGKTWLYNEVPANSPVSITSVNDGLWHQIVGVRGNNQVKIYVDGYPVEDSQPDQGLDNPIPGTPFLVGGYPFGGNPVGTYTGLIDDIQIFNHDLSDEEVQWLFDHPGETLCSPTPPDLISWWEAEGNVSDSIGVNNGTLNGNTTFGAGKVGQAFSFDGDDDFIRVLSPQNIPSGNSPRTIGAWINSTGQVNANGNTHTYQGIFGYGPLNPAAGQALFFERAGDSSQPYVNRLFQMNLLAGGAGTSIIEYNTWYHVALTHDGTATRLYVNGQLENTTSMNHNTVIDNAIGLLIGTSPPFDGWHANFKGFIDEVQIFNRALSADEIASIHNAGSAGQCRRYFVTAKATGNAGGSVTSDVGGLSYTYPSKNIGTTSYLNHGTTVTLTATAVAGATATWTTCSGTRVGEGTSQATCTYSSLDWFKTAEATFTLNTYTVTVNAQGNGTGTVQSNVGGVSYNYPAGTTGTTTALNHGTNVVFTATAAAGSTVDWTTCTGTASGNGTASATCTYASLDGNKTALATFTLNTYTVTANAQGNGAGTVQTSVGEVSYFYPAVISGTTTALNYGTIVVLTATAAVGSTVAWTTCAGTAAGNGTASATCTYDSLDGNKTAAATFTLNTFSLTITPSGTGSGSVTGNGIDCAWDGNDGSGTCGVHLDYDTAVSLTATPSAGSTFSGWIGGSGSASGCSGTGACTFNLTEGSGIGSIFARKSLIYLPLILRH